MTTKVLNFLFKYSNYKRKDRAKIKEIILKHQAFRTGMVIKNKKEQIIAVARWNVSPSKKLAYLLDVIIRPDYRRNGMIKQMIINGLRVWPDVEWLTWERGSRKLDRGWRAYEIREILKQRRRNVENNSQVG